MHSDELCHFLLDYLNNNPDVRNLSPCFKMQAHELTESVPDLILLKQTYKAIENKNIKLAQQHASKILSPVLKDEAGALILKNSGASASILSNTEKERYQKYILVELEMAKRYLNGCQFTIYLNRRTYSDAVFVKYVRAISDKLKSLKITDVKAYDSDIDMSVPNVSFRMDSGTFIINGILKSFNYIHPVRTSAWEMVQINGLILLNDPICMRINALNLIKPSEILRLDFRPIYYGFCTLQNNLRSGAGKVASKEEIDDVIVSPPLSSSASSQTMAGVRNGLFSTTSQTSLIPHQKRKREMILNAGEHTSAGAEKQEWKSAQGCSEVLAPVKYTDLQWASMMKIIKPLAKKYLKEMNQKKILVDNKENQQEQSQAKRARFR